MVKTCFLELIEPICHEITSAEVLMTSLTQTKLCVNF